MEKERVKRDHLIEDRKQKYYQSLKRAETKAEQERPKLHDQVGLTKLDSKRSSIRTLDQVSELSRYITKAFKHGVAFSRIVAGFTILFAQFSGTWASL